MNRKLQHNIILLLIGCIIFTGCGKDFLDTKIDTYDTDATIITNSSSLFKFANTFYTYLPYGFTSLDDNLMAAASDDAQQTSKVSTNALLFNQGGLNPHSIDIKAGSNFYNDMYQGIRAVNFFLDYSKNYKEFLALNRDIERDTINYERDLRDISWYRAEAHIARAYYYYELIKRWGGVPIITKTMEQADDKPLHKSSFNEVVDFIVNEIDEYKDSLQANWETSQYSDQVGRFDYGSALALKANVLLVAASPLHNKENDSEKWERAAEAAFEVIALNQYSLDPNYDTYFISNNSLQSPETIFAVRKSAGNSMETRNYPISTPGGNTGIVPTENLVSSYEYVDTLDATNPYLNRDPRLYASVVVNGSTWNGRTIDGAPGGTDDMTKPNTSSTGYYLKKFLTDNLNLEQGETTQHPWIVCRYAEILLNYAEAMNEAYGPDDPHDYAFTAREAIQMIRDRASTALPPVTVTSPEEFREIIHHERRVELAFEGHRYWDLLRWEKAYDVLNSPIYGVKISKDSEDLFQYEVIEVANRVFPKSMYYYPFPYSEIVNSKGILEQNPYY